MRNSDNYTYKCSQYSDEDVVNIHCFMSQDFNIDFNMSQDFNNAVSLCPEPSMFTIICPETLYF